METVTKYDLDAITNKIIHAFADIFTTQICDKIPTYAVTNNNGLIKTIFREESSKRFDDLETYLKSSGQTYKDIYKQVIINNYELCKELKNIITFTCKHIHLFML
jgi:hypothetical protein